MRVPFLAAALVSPAAGFRTSQQKQRGIQSQTQVANCICIFDVDRTLTAKQGIDQIEQCAGVQNHSAIIDLAYDGGTLILSELAVRLQDSFCGECYFGIVSAGTASGPDSENRDKVDTLVQEQYNVGGWVDECPSPVDGTKVTSCGEGQKQNAVSDILTWLSGEGISIPDENVHFFDDKQNNIEGFEGGPYNAHQISCESRDGHRGRCGGTFAELVDDAGQNFCPPAPPAPPAPPLYLAPVCLDSEACHAAHAPPRDPLAPTRPLTETGGFGMSYGPLPTRTVGRFHNDDMMAPWFRGQWAWDGRNDLGIMANMGANMVRLYGNDPRWDAREFLDTANSWGIKVVAGISDFPYTSGDNKCIRGRETSHFDCYEALKETYETRLTNGTFMLEDEGRYHPALDALVVINEPDLKLINRDRSVRGVDPQYMKVVLSAIDGILAAELEQGIDITSKDSIKLTAPFSYSPGLDSPNLHKLKEYGLECCVQCHESNERYGNGELMWPQCSSLPGNAGLPVEEGGMKCGRRRLPNMRDECPALPMIVDFYEAFLDPSSVDYTFRTPGWREAIQNRFVHSFNGFIKAWIMEQQFLVKYVQLPFNKDRDASDMVPVFMGEYGDKNVARDLEMSAEDLDQAMTLVRDRTNPFYAFNYFEFSVSYWKQCNEDAQQDWDDWVAEHWSDREGYPGHCDERLHGTFGYGPIPVSRSGHVDAGEGDWPMFDIPCLQSVFDGKAETIAAAFGGVAPDSTLCRGGWNSGAKQYCVASRSEIWATGDGVGWVCGHLGEHGMSCMQDLPDVCDDAYGRADWAFSMFFEMNKQSHTGSYADICSFGGQGVVTTMPSRPECVHTDYPSMPAWPPGSAPAATTIRPTTTTTTTADLNLYVCSCSVDGIVNGVNTHRPGCKAHSGARWGNFCYITGTNDQCPHARHSRGLGVYYRPC